MDRNCTNLKLEHNWMLREGIILLTRTESVFLLVDERNNYASINDEVLIFVCGECGCESECKYVYGGIVLIKKYLQPQKNTRIAQTMGQLFVLRAGVRLNNLNSFELWLNVARNPHLNPHLRRILVFSHVFCWAVTESWLFCNTYV